MTATVGGISLNESRNYQLSYFQMAGSGIAALISSILLIKVHTKDSVNKKTVKGKNRLMMAMHNRMSFPFRNKIHIHRVCHNKCYDQGNCKTKPEE